MKLLAGNPGKRPLNANEPDAPKADAVPDPPDWVSAEVAAAWRHDAPMLYDAGLLTVLDEAAFLGLCDLRVRWTRAQKALSESSSLLIKTPNGMPMPHPLIAIVNQAWKLYLLTLAEFGLTPSARSRVTVKAAQETESVFAKIAQGR
jgi:P27 family predicted phage terminase small subunit